MNQQRGSTGIFPEIILNGLFAFSSGKKSRIFSPCFCSRHGLTYECTENFPVNKKGRVSQLKYKPRQRLYNVYSLGGKCQKYKHRRENKALLDSEQSRREGSYRCAVVIHLFKSFISLIVWSQTTSLYKGRQKGSSARSRTHSSAAWNKSSHI